MSDGDLIEFVRGFRDGILDGRSSRWCCFMVCAPLVTLLRLQGVKCEMVETDLGDLNHFWIRLDDGRALDPTADQFNSLYPHGIVASGPVPPVYLGAPLNIHGDTPDTAAGR